MKKYKIVCIAQIYNELEKGNLERFFKYVRPLADEIIVYDDGSTDGSYKFAKKFTKNIIKGERNEFDKEMFHKDLLLKEALEFKPDFIFYLDADEVFSRGGRKKLEEVCDWMVEKDLDGASFHKLNLWRSRSWRRVDSLFDIGWFTHLWRVRRGMSYKNLKIGLHQNPYPSNIKKIERSKNFSILHYGFSDFKNISHKYFTYKHHGQKGYDELERLIDEKKLKLKKINKNLFPQGLWKDDEMPRKLSYEESMIEILKFRKNPTNPKYSKPSDFSKITAITPVYNREDLIQETVESVLSQNYPNLEYIVIDDGSVDSSLSLLKKYKDRIKLLTQKNMGETKTVNKGIRMATGDLIVIVNSDDPLMPGSLFEANEFMRENQKILVGYPDWWVIDEKGNLKNLVNVHEYDYEYMFTRQHCIVGPGAFIRKKALRFVKGRSEKFKYVADFEFWLKLGLYGDFKRIPKALATFRIHSRAQSQYAKGNDMAFENIRLVDHILSLPNFPHDLKKRANTAYSSAYFLAGGKAITFSSKFYFYSNSLIKDPLIFLQKFKYELVKLKHIIAHF